MSETTANSRCTHFHSFLYYTFFIYKTPSWHSLSWIMNYKWNDENVYFWVSNITSKTNSKRDVLYPAVKLPVAIKDHWTMALWCSWSLFRKSVFLKLLWAETTLSQAKSANFSALSVWEWADCGECWWEMCWQPVKDMFVFFGRLFLN